MFHGIRISHIWTELCFWVVNELTIKLLQTLSQHMASSIGCYYTWKFIPLQTKCNLIRPLSCMDDMFLNKPDLTGFQMLSPCVNTF